MRQYFSLHVKNLNKKNKMKTWVFTCLIMLQRILEHYIGAHTTCTGKGGWLSLTDIPGLCKSTQERPEPLLSWVICTPRLDQHRTWRQLLTAGSQRYYYTALIIFIQLFPTFEIHQESLLKENDSHDLWAESSPNSPKMIPLWMLIHNWLFFFTICLSPFPSRYVRFMEFSVISFNWY